MSSHTAASTSAASPHLTAIASIVSPLTASLASTLTSPLLTSTLAPASLTLVSAAIASIVAPLTASLASESTVAAIIAPATALVHPRVTGIRSHLLDLHLVSSNLTGSLLYQLPGNALLLEGDEAEVLGRVVFALVYRPDDLSDGAELTKVVLDFIVGNPGTGEPAHVDFARLDVCLRDFDTFTLQNNNKEIFVCQHYLITLSLWSLYSNALLIESLLL